MFGVLPLASGEVYCYASAPAPPGVRHDDEAAELKRRFGGWHDPIPGLIGGFPHHAKTPALSASRPEPDSAPG